MGLKKDRPPILKANIVCAEPMPGEKELLHEFLKTLRDDHLEALIRQVMQVPDRTRVRATKAMAESLSDLVRTVWEKMRLAGEAGSLLKIEEELQDAIRKGQDEWEERLPLFRFTEYGLSEEPKERLVRFVPGDVDGERTTFWHKAEGLVRQALDEFVEYASNGGRFLRSLFVEDARQGLGFVDVCRQRYDVVLMNPPFGSPSLVAEPYLHRAYPYARYEAYGQFLIRAQGWADCFAGALTSRGYLFLANYQSIRESMIPYITTFLDLGAGVLDGAFVEVSTVMSKEPCQSVLCIDDRRGSDRGLRGEDLASLPQPRIFQKRLIEQLDQSPFCYDSDPRILELFQSGYTLDKAVGGIARVGLATGDNERFIRCHWEAPTHLIHQRWRFHAKGGEYLPFKPDVHLVVDWSDDGRFIEEAFVGARIRKADVYFRPAVTYSRRSLKGLSFRALPAGCICGEKGPVIISEGNENALLALANSSTFKYLVTIQSAASAFEIGAIQRVPFPLPFERFRERLSRLARFTFGLLARIIS